MAQPAARGSHNPKVVSSILTVRSFLFLFILTSFFLVVNIENRVGSLVAGLRASSARGPGSIPFFFFLNGNMTIGESFTYN